MTCRKHPLFKGHKYGSMIDEPKAKMLKIKGKEKNM